MQRNEINQDLPLISVVIPSYKAEVFIERTINSCLEQEQVNVEIIVIEDGIYDDTASIIKNKYNKFVKLYSFKENKGACYARNYGMMKTTSDYIVFLDADDYFEKNILYHMYQSMLSNQSSIVFSNVVKKWKDKELDMNIPINIDNIDVICRMISGQAGPPPCGIMWNKKELNRIGNWNETYSKNQDGELLIRAMFNNCKVSINKIGKAIYWQHDGERISRRISDKALEDQKKLELYIKDNITSDQKYSKIEPYLNAYRFGVLVRVYSYNLQNWIEYWENAIQEKSILAFKFKNKKKFVAFLFYKIFGMKLLLKVLNILKINII